MTTAYLSSALLLSVGILVGSFPQNALAAGIGTTSGRMSIPRITINRSSKDNGGSLSYTGAEYATHRPYKVDFDLLRASDQSHELEMPLLRNNDISDESKDSDFILVSDPTLRSRRRRRRQVEPSQNKVISATSSDFQRFNLCLPYFHTNPMCRQMFLGMTNTNNPIHATNNVVQNVHGHQYPSALAVPSSASPTTATFYVPQAFPPSSSISSLSSSGSVPVVAGGTISRNDLAILNYYQQQPFPHQQNAPFQQIGVFQGPLPVQRQRPQYDGIHTKYPYPYPPTLDLGSQQPIQAVVPESGSTGDEESNAATTDVPSDLSQTTPIAEAGQGASVDPQGQQGADQQDTAAPGSFPDSPVAQPQEPDNNVEPVPVTTLPPSSQPAEPSPAVPEPPSPPSSQEGGEGLPVSPGQLQDQSLFQPPSQQIPQIPIQQIQQVQIQPQVDLAMQKRLREKEEEVRHLKSQLDLSNGRLDQTKLQLEQSNDQLEQTKVHLEQAKSQLEEANEQLDQARTQLEQANLQVVSYEQENGMVKDQFMKSEEANIKLRDRVLQLENTNQHLQEQNGQLQQVSAEQRQQLNGLKSSLKQVKDQLENNQNQGIPPLSQALTPEAVKHRKEIEDFLIRIRKLDEENATCKKQVRLYQLKVNYIMEQQRQQQKQQPQKKKQPEIPQEQATPQELQEPQPAQPQQPQPQQPVSASDITAHVDVDDDELDPELSRMDAEIAELQKKADEVAGAIQKLPDPENILSPVAPVLDVASQAAPTTAAVVKTENEFPGEAVQVDPKQTKHKQPTASVVEPGLKNEAADVAKVESASRNVPSGAPAWEQPAGF